MSDFKPKWLLFWWGVSFVINGLIHGAIPFFTGADLQARTKSSFKGLLYNLIVLLVYLSRSLFVATEHSRGLAWR